MQKFTIVESYIYEVHAETEEHARELFQTYMEASSSYEEQETGVTFIDNQLDVEEWN